MVNSSPPPGLIQPTMASYAPGAGNPRQDAMLQQQQMNAKQNGLNQAVMGGSRRKHRKHRNTRRTSKTRKGLNYNLLDWNKAISGGAADRVVVPQLPMSYTPKGGPGTNPNDQIAKTSSMNMQSISYGAGDQFAFKGGRRGGSNPDWKWGCQSGGRHKKRKSCGKRKSSKHRHTNKRH